MLGIGSCSRQVSEEVAAVDVKVREVDVAIIGECLAMCCPLSQTKIVHCARSRSARLCELELGAWLCELELGASSCSGVSVCKVCVYGRLAPIGVV